MLHLDTHQIPRNEPGALSLSALNCVTSTVPENHTTLKTTSYAQQHSLLLSSSQDQKAKPPRMRSSENPGK